MDRGARPGPFAASFPDESEIMTEPEPAPGPTAPENLADQVGQATQSMELADPDAGASWIDRRINQLAEAIGVAVLATIVVLIFANAAGRYLAAAPILWAEEIVIALIPWLAMCGVFLSVRRRQLISLEYFTAGMPARTRSAVGLFVAVLSAATFVYLAYYGFQYVSLFGADVTTYLQLPTGWFTSAMLVGAGAVALAFLVNACRDLKARRDTSRRGRS
jgi:TRAP-type C4-dicarboxylate transport system permease small subunit